MTPNNLLRNERAPIYRKLIRLFWVLLVLGVIGAVLFFVYLAGQDLPTFEQLESPKDKFASEVYFDDGSVIGKYFVENRVPVDFEDLNPHLVNALVATEDERFYRHSGIDLQALGRVAVGVLTFNTDKGGGSTITQQLAKLLYSDRNFSGMNKIRKIFALVSIKFKEWITAVKLEKSYTKQEIIAMYLNHFNFINGAYGIKAASEIYFGKPQSELEPQEAATLVGMLKNPSLYDPKRFVKNALNRRNVVLNQMRKKDHFDRVTYDTLKTIPMDMSNFKRQSHLDGMATHFRMVLRSELMKLLKKEEFRKADGTPYDIFRDGLKIYTTIDPLYQKHAEAAIVPHMSYQQEKYWKVWAKSDPWTYLDEIDEIDEEKIAEEEERQEIQLKIRAKSLRRQVFQTDRFMSMRSIYLKGVIDDVSKEADGLSLKDYVIERLINEEKDKSVIADLLNRKMISTKLAVKYRKALKSKHWPKLKDQWNKLDATAEKVFKTPVKMKVFAYNDKMEKDTVMSPLDSIKYHRMILQLGSISIDPHTGHVKSWVGSVNYKYFKFDHCTSKRQVGSTFKPFVYATAISQMGLSPCHKFHDIPYTIKPGDKNFRLSEPWSPGNAKDEFSNELLTLKQGLKTSTNSISVRLMIELGDTEPVRTLVKNMGLDKIPRAPSICLGSTDLSVLEMTGAYTTFANNGQYKKPVFIKRIEDKNGYVIYEELEEDRVALHPTHNYVMVEMLKYAHGYSGGKIKSPFMGKTGTTNDYVDGWFMGATPNLVVGTWVGGEDQWIRFLDLGNGQGARMAKPYCVDFIHRVEQDKEIALNQKEQFYVPPGDIGIELDCNKYNLEGIENPDGSNPNIGDDVFGDELEEDMFSDEEEEFEEEEFEEEGF